MFREFHLPKGTCAITGTTGFLGRHIAKRMKKYGWSVIKMQRRKTSISDSDDKSVRFSLGENIDPKELENVDILIHCAYDFSCNNMDSINEINISGTRMLFDAAEKAKVGLIVFISSMHAFEGCKTMYGKAKLAGEKCVLDHKGIVIRPGTLYLEENGKLYGGVGGQTMQSFEKLFSISPVVPILYSKKPTMYTTHIHDLCDLIAEAVSVHKLIDRPICAVNENPLTLKQFLLKIKRRQNGKNVMFIPLPWQIPWIMLILLEKMNIKLPFRSDSILSFFDQNPDPDFSTFKHLKTRIRAF
jgi:nucleoside-diphosphate-sugar epimerase